MCGGLQHPCGCAPRAVRFCHLMQLQARGVGDGQGKDLDLGAISLGSYLNPWNLTAQVESQAEQLHTWAESATPAWAPMIHITTRNFLGVDGHMS